jgi:hypothetical protein
MGIYSKFFPEELPTLPKAQHERQQTEKYMDLILEELVGKVEEQLGEGQPGGKKGFCFLCRKPADYYCKDTKVPVCSVGCKKAHLEMLSSCSALNFQYSQDFRFSIEQILLSNISRGKSPALSIDFLVAIYLYSDYHPQVVLPHGKVLSLPVIFERIWLLYLSYYGKTGECCEHIFASCLSE